MITNLNDLDQLNAEIERVILNFEDYHNKMANQKEFYNNSAVYATKSGDVKHKTQLTANLLKVFADKNIQHTSDFPIIKVPTAGADQEQRYSASIREKILYAVHKKSGTESNKKRWARDGTLSSCAVAETKYDFKNKCVKVVRHNPRYCFWELANDNSKEVKAFWAVFPITKEECFKKYGFNPTYNGFSTAIKDAYLTGIDNQEWFMQAIRWDAETRVAWVGNQFIEEPHKHMLGQIPIDICFPFDDEHEHINQGSFYLEPLLPLQAELNHNIRQRASIVARMANPVVWGRGIVGKQFDEIKDKLESAGGGFVGLRNQGELGLLQVNDVDLINKHMADIIQQMMRISGFTSATFGESVGANTSGDALSMYFSPTQKLIEYQNISWTAFFESINAKILKFYDVMATSTQEFSLDGYLPRGTVVAIKNDDNTTDYRHEKGGYSINFTKQVIGGKYISVVTFNPVTPKNEILDKRFWLDASNLGQISRTTFYENIGILSPEDELALLEKEKGNPMLNPEGTSTLIKSASDYAKNSQQQPANGALPSPTPAVFNQPGGMMDG